MVLLIKQKYKNIKELLTKESETGSWSYSCGVVVYCLAKCLIRTECSSRKNKGALIQLTAGNAL